MGTDNANLWERREKAARRRRRDLGSVDGSNCEGVADAEAGDEAAAHEEGVAGG